MSVQQEKFREIADVIREKTGKTDPIKPSNFASEIHKVYDKGFEDGQAQGGGGEIEPPLPEGYTRLDYIQSDGTQYINTGIIANTPLRSVIDLEWHTTHVDDAILAARNGDNRLYLLWRGGTIGIGYGTYISVPGSVSKNVKYQIETILSSGEQSLKVDNKVRYGAVSSASYNLEIPLYLFANNAEGVASAFSKIRLYGCCLYNEETLVRQYVPCINPDGEIGLYDYITESFFGNDGTGTFVAGQIANEDDYQAALLELGVNV